MECSEPAVIRDEELMAYLDGAPVRPRVVAHIASCPHCSQQVARYRQLAYRLTQNLYRWDCPANQLLGEYHLGMLSNEAELHIKQHLAGCVLCAAEVTALSGFLTDPLFATATGAAPQISINTGTVNRNHHDILAGTRQIVEQVQGQALAGMRTIIATLFQPPQLALQRDIAASTSSSLWPRRYTAEDVLIALQLERDPHPRELAEVQLLGLITATGKTVADFEGVQVVLRSQSLQASNAVYTQHVDDLGNFLFSALAPATYALEVHIQRGIVLIEQLHLSLQDQLDK